MSSSTQGYGSITIILATAIVLSSTLMLLSIFLLEGVEAQNGPISTYSNETSGIQKNFSGTNEAETYIVTLKNQSSSADLNDITKMLEEKGASITHVYNQSISGFSVHVPSDIKEETIDSLTNDTRVNSIEPDQIMSLPPPLD